MANEPIVELNLIDVYGNLLKEKVDVIFRHLELNETIKFSRVANGPISISGLRGAPFGRYRMEIDPPSYQYIAQFVNVPSSGPLPLTVKFPVDPKKIKSVNFPAYTNISPDLQTLLTNSDEVLGYEGLTGKALYDALSNDNIRRAGMLNIAAKTLKTHLSNGRSVISGVNKIVELRGDRFFATVPKQLREDTKNSVVSGLFEPAGHFFHHPPANYDHAGSFKTNDRYGNLQLTFLPMARTGLQILI